MDLPLVHSMCLTFQVSSLVDGVKSDFNNSPFSSKSTLYSSQMMDTALIMRNIQRIIQVGFISSPPLFLKMTWLRDLAFATKSHSS